MPIFWRELITAPKRYDRAGPGRVGSGPFGPHIVSNFRSLCIDVELARPSKDVIRLCIIVLDYLRL